MLHENLKTYRKAKGFSQEELAVRLHVVRQTVSKWEKGLSVPDAAMLMNIAEVFEVTVSDLLGTVPAIEADENSVAEQLSRINEQLAIKNRRARRIWKAIAIILGVFLAAYILLIILSMAAFQSFNSTSAKIVTENTEIVASEQVLQA